MSDIALVWNDEAQSADFAIEANDLKTDDTLETSIKISLFTDRRAEETDVLPEGETDRRGWWADDVDGTPDPIGSRLWLLARSKQTPDVIMRAEEYIREALNWMLEDKVTDRIDVVVTNPRTGSLGMVITINRPALHPVEYRFNRTWLAQEAQRE